MRRFRFLAIGFAVTTLLFPCGTDWRPSFLPQQSPEDETAFLQGRLGLITPALATQEELIAFRYLSGRTMDSGWQPKPAVTTDGALDHRFTETWLNARDLVAPIHSSCCLGTYRISHLSQNVFYPNCLDDSFLNAANTLADRKSKYKKAELQGWIDAQDVVFANCDGIKPSLPAEPAADLSPLARADRRYQIAAAHFYGEDLETAEKLFREIAADQSSPWHAVAAYLVGRTLLREFSLAGKSEAAEAARAQFNRIASDPAAGPLRDSARGLLEHLDAVEHSGETLQSLSGQLLAPHPDASYAHVLENARYVLLADSFRPAISKPDIPEPFDWVKTLESGNEAHAVERWRTTKSVPWLTVALIHASGKDTAAADLIAAAATIPADSPAAVTVGYNAIRLRIERGETAGPRAQLNRLLANERTQPASVRNAWRAERMRVATSFDDFLRWAPRIPVEDTSPILADDSLDVLNFHTPLAKIVQAVQSPRVPAWSASKLALTAWTRAFILEDNDAMRTLAPLVARAHPNLAADLTPQDASGRFHTSLMIARNALLTPLAAVELRKPFGVNDAWWCGVDDPENIAGAFRSTVAWRIPISMKVPDTVITPAERAEAETEFDRLSELGSAQEVLAPVILAWAKAHPDDPLVPEALYRVVRVVRYGCREEPDNAKISKAAFDLLHTRYPKDPWTTKTPYWFK
jgi:hypothetical protein